MLPQPQLAPPTQLYSGALLSCYNNRNILMGLLIFFETDCFKECGCEVSVFFCFGNVWYTIRWDPEPKNLKYDIAKVILLWNFNLDFKIFEF